MAIEDWDVEIHDVVARKNSAKNPYTQLPIDPDGLTQSVFTMTLTHRPSGKVLQRADLHSTPTPDALRHYALGVIEVAEKNMAVQKQTNANGDETAPSPLKGPLTVTLPPKEQPTQEQRDAAAYHAAEGLKKQIQALAPDDAEALASAQALIDTHKAAAVAQVKAQLAKVATDAAAAAVVGG